MILLNYNWLHKLFIVALFSYFIFSNCWEKNFFDFNQMSEVGFHSTLFWIKGIEKTFPILYHLTHVFDLPISFHKSSIVRSMLEIPPMYISNNAFYSFLSTKHTIIQYQSIMQHRITHVFQKCAIHCWYKKHRYLWHE